MPIIVNLDVMMAKRHMGAGELAETIGITPANQIMMVVVAGRFKNHSEGMSIDELSYLAKQLGMRDALNLDGGGSSTLWNNKTGIVNHPYDNKKFDHEGEREVSNAILVIPNK